MFSLPPRAINIIAMLHETNFRSDNRVQKISEISFTPFSAVGLSQRFLQIFRDLLTNAMS